MKNVFSILMALLLPTVLFAQPSEDWTDVNLSTADNQVIPAYLRFEQGSSELAAAAVRFCQAPDAVSLEEFKAGFHLSMDGWQQIQHIQFGPVTYFNWNFRLHYWPDEKGTGARQLDALIADKNMDLLSTENFARESVGVQGFPALERMLFEEGALVTLENDTYRCQVAQAITRNISEIASGVRQRWADEFRTTIENADERGFFESAEDATIDFLKAQVEPIRRIQQQKLEQVIGESAGQTRTRRAESWRSERSIRNIKLNVMALEDLFNGVHSQIATQSVHLANVFQTDDVALITDVFAQLNVSLENIPDSFEQALALAQGHEQLLEIAAQLDALFEAFEAGLKNTDLYLGFNSLDGD